MFLFIDEFTVQIFHIYKDVERIQKGMREDQIKLKLNVFNFDLIIINYNQISYILLPYQTTIIWKIFYLTYIAQTHVLMGLVFGTCFLK
jgi:hypothetical protein